MRVRPDVPALVRVADATRRADVLCMLMRVRRHRSGHPSADAQQEASAWAGCRCPRCISAFRGRSSLTMVGRSSAGLTSASEARHKGRAPSDTTRPGPTRVRSEAATR